MAKKLLKCLLLSLIGFVLFSCKTEMEKDNFNKSGETEQKLYSVLPDYCTTIGSEHNEMLSDFYFGNTNRAAREAGVDYKNLSAEDYFGKISERYEFMTFSSMSARNAENSKANNSVTQMMLEKDLISNEAGKYIEQVENILHDLPDTIEETRDVISSIELDCISTSNESVLPEFISYAETAKSSLEFWAENIELLEGTANDNTGRWIFKDLWNKYKHRLGMMAASDAAGAAAGAAIGFAATKSSYVAAGCAVVASAVSSEEGFRQDCVCIIIPLEKIQAEINKRK